MEKTRISWTASSARWLRLASAGLALVGCGQGGAASGADDPNSGELALRLDANGTVLQSATYVITGPNGFHRTDSIDVTQSTVVSATIGGIPAGAGFAVTLSAATSDGKASCVGSSSFDVSAGATSNVLVSLDCHEMTRDGSLAVEGDLEFCPVVDGLSAIADTAAVGGTLTLSAAAHDRDAGPAPLTYQWSTTSGSLVSSGASAVFTCSSAGPATIAVTVSDGSNCPDSKSLTVACTVGTDSGGEPAHPAPVPAPFVALLGVSLAALGVRKAKRGP